MLVIRFDKMVPGYLYEACVYNNTKGAFYEITGYLSYDSLALGILI